MYLRDLNEERSWPTCASPAWSSDYKSAAAPTGSNICVLEWLARPRVSRSTRTVEAIAVTTITGGATRPISALNFPAWPPLRHGLSHPPRAKADPENHGPGKNRGPVLVIEDDPSILSTVADVLQFEGYELALATNGAQGLAILEHSTPALVLLDMRMPVLDGWEFARIMKERGIDVPVLVMTAAHDARKWAQEIDADGYIAKPFEVTDLLSAVEGLLRPDRAN